jgi:glutamate formiminotransferase/formiminotetrahydrofolate cyclodeaminase
MSAPLIECIPNFSEAKRPEIVQKILDSIQSVPDVHILDKHSDLDHNRTVVTFIGTPDAVEKAAFQCIGEAAKWIDLDEHKGAHPRIGATDVVPFIPIRGIAMEDCVELTRRLGKRVGEELGIPVYLYEESATRSERQNLEIIRKGQYETLKEEMGKIPERDPDFGPRRISKAGATVIGARQPLIAFNVYLATNDVAIAQKIARSVRQSNGGFKFVKAMGVMVEGRAQVSMNLTNYHQSSIARIVEFIRREAERFGTSIHHSEIVGLAPQESLIDAAVWYLQLDQFEAGQILEKRLYEVQSEPGWLKCGGSKSSFLENLAAASPTPGGGSASAYTAAESAALVAMVAKLTMGKKKYAEIESAMQQISKKAEEYQKSFEKAVLDDSLAFNDIMAALKMPKEDDIQQKKRSGTIEKATLQAIEVPFSVSAMIPGLFQLIIEVAMKGNINAISDAGTAGALAKAAFIGTTLNIRINSQGMQNPSLAENFLKKLEEIEDKVNHEYQTLQKVLSERSSLMMPG